MPITEAIVKQVKYPPEKLPDSWFGNVPAGAEFAPPILDLRRFAPYIVILEDIQLTPNALVELRARYDTLRVFENTAAMPTLVPAVWALAGVGPLPAAWRLLAKEILYYNLFGFAPGVAAYTSHYSMWAFIPTIAHKLLYGITLTRDEQAISEELGIKNTVEKGILPLPISQQIEREYHVLAEETHSRNINIAIAATTYTIESIYPRLDEFVVLTKVAAAPALAANDVRLIIGRDDDANYAELRAFALGLAAGGEVRCFIPAMKEIRLTTTSTVAPAWHLFRYTYQRIKLTNLLRVRFGLVSQDEIPKDTWNKVIAGVL